MSDMSFVVLFVVVVLMKFGIVCCMIVGLGGYGLKCGLSFVVGLIVMMLVIVFFGVIVRICLVIVLFWFMFVMIGVK